MSQTQIAQLENDLGFKLQKKTSYNDFGQSRCYLYLDNKIKGLNLRNSNLTDLPKSLCNLKSLEFLDLNDNQISNIEYVSQLPDLTHLYLNNNSLFDHSPLSELRFLTYLSLINTGLKDLSWLASLTMLMDLNISENQIVNFEEIRHLSNLESLSLWNTGLSSLSIIDKLRKLKHLDISENNIAEIVELSDLKKMKSLYLSNNHISELEPLSNLHMLVKLHASENEIVSIKPLHGLKNIKELYCSENQIEDISPIENMMKLVDVDFSANFIAKIPDLSKLSKITHFEISKNLLNDIENIKTLTSLKVLSIWDNEIANISSLKNLTNLTNLDLSHNKIENIAVLENLKKLKTIDLWYNSIIDLNPLTDLTNLIEVILRKNLISDITPLKSLPKLHKLDISDNLLKNLPSWLIESNLKIIKHEEIYRTSIGCVSLEDNPFENVPIDLIDLGNDAIKDYLRSLVEGAQPINEIKVILLGEGAAGKTSLMNFLQGKPYLKGRSQTHGINLEKCIADSGVALKIWDFGGQDIMHHTHQFFLTHKSVYILVLNARENSDTEKWLKLIQVFGGDSPIIIVTNKIDENPSDHENIKFLNTKYPSLKNRYVRISCEQNINLDQFKEILTDTISELLHVRTLWGDSWLKVKLELEEMRQAESLKDFIHFEKYDEICKKHNVPTSHRETLIIWLHRLGVVTYFPDSNLSETHVINPSWLTEAFYGIINSEIVANKFGRFTINDLSIILDNQRYPKQKYRFLIDLMIKFELCYQIDESRYLIPDLLNKEEPNFSFDPKLSLNFKYKYKNLLPKAILPKFMVRRSREIIENNNWRTGLLISDKYFESEALIRVDEDEKEITVYVNGNEKRGYLASIISNFESINRLYKGLEYEQLVPCRCDKCVNSLEPYYFNYEVLINLREKRKRTHICEKSYNDVDIHDLLGILITPEDLKNELTELVGKGNYQTRKDLMNGDVTGFINTISSIFSSVSYLLFERSEKAYHTPLFILLRAIFSSNARADEIQSKGRADIIINLERFLYIIEIKLDGSAKEAMDQIHANKYYQPYVLEGKKIKLIGINFSSALRNIETISVEDFN